MHKFIAGMVWLPAIAVHPVSCLAQDVKQGAVIEEVMVTAQRRSENLQNVPIAISAVTGEALAAMKLESAQDLQTLVPNLVYSSYGGHAQPYLRGIGSDQALVTADPSVATYIDGVYQVGTISILDRFFDIERVEVLKGPQAALYGRNATGGAINITTKYPTQEFEGTAMVGAGNEGLMESAAYASGGISSNLAAGVYVSWEERDSTGQNRFISGTEKYSSTDMRGKAVWTPLEDLTIKASVGYRSEKNPDAYMWRQTQPNATGMFLGGTVSQRPRVLYESVEIAAKPRETSFTLNAEYDLGFAQLVSITAYNKSKTRAALDLDGTEAELLQASLDAYVRSVTEEVQLISSTSGRLDWIVGALYLDESRPQRDIVFDIPALGFRQLGDNFMSGRSIEPYAEATYEITQALSVTGGVRYIDEKREAYSKQRLVAPIETPVTRFDTERSHFDRFNPKITVSYKLAELLLYTTYSEGFKSGRPSDDSSTPVLLPEVVKSYEIGLKSDLANGRVRLNAAAFYTDFKNKQVQSFGTAQDEIVSIRNAASATIKGIEADLAVQVTEALRATVAGGYLDAQYDSFPIYASFANNAPLPGNESINTDISGRRMERSPKFTGSLRLDYQQQLGELGELQLSTNYYRTGDFSFDPGGQLREDGYGLLGASVSYFTTSRSWRFSVWGKNLTDETYRANAQLNEYGTLTVDAPARTYGATLTYTF